MKTSPLGRTGLEISRLCFGTLTVGPAQADLSVEEAADIICYAVDQGVNLIDTAEYYDNYSLIRHVLRQSGSQPYIATKTYAYSRQQAESSLEQARRETGLDVIDLFLLHEQESVLTLDGHREAFTYLIEQRDAGRIRAVGVSTHAVEPVLALAQAVGQTDAQPSSVWRREQLDAGIYREADVIHPLLNLSGVGILDGTAEDMADACRLARQAGIGLYGMKMLGGGTLLSRFDEAVRYVLDLPFLDGVAVGMQSKLEVDMNVALFEQRPVPEQWLAESRARRRVLKIEDWCTGCGQCVRRCGESALRLVDGKAVVDRGRCVLCGYCAAVCRDFAIKIY